MAKHNFGMVKATFTNYLNESENPEFKQKFSKFMNLIKESKVMNLQFHVYKNLENKHIPNENLAIKYIDENINILNKEISYEEFVQTNSELSELVSDLNEEFSYTNNKLYQNIDMLIEQSLSTKNVDQLHEAFTFVLEHLKNNKPAIAETKSIEYNHIPKEFLVKKAIEKFNTRFSSLNESNKIIFKSIVSNDINEKQKVFENLKTHTANALKTLLDSPDYNESEINESIKKTTSMQFAVNTYSTDILILNELYSDITQ